MFAPSTATTTVETCSNNHKWVGLPQMLLTKLEALRTQQQLNCEVAISILNVRNEYHAILERFSDSLASLKAKWSVKSKGNDRSSRRASGAFA